MVQLCLLFVPADLWVFQIHSIFLNKSMSFISENPLSLWFPAQPKVNAPSNMQAAMGDSVSLVCEVEVYPRPVVTWYRKDGEMPE